MANTNVPSATFTLQGLVLPTESAILAGVQADYNTAFGGGMNMSLSTPQGQLASSQAAIIGNSNDLFLQLVNGIDPAYAAGRMQDAIGRIYFLTRNPAVATTVNCTCLGAVGTIIPQGALATDGVNLWENVTTSTIPVGGSITLEFACIVTGPIACPANTVNQIFTTIPGWDTVNNPSPGQIGSNVEGRAAFETRRQLTVQANSMASNAAILGNVLKVPGVTDAFVVDNPNSTSSGIGGVTIPANTVYVAVAGSYSNANVAIALWQKKIPGIPWYSGNTSATVTDGSYATSPPSYTISWVNPTSTPIYFDVSIANSTNVPADALTQITNAISNAFTGSDGGPKARIGATIYASRFYAGIAALGSWAQIVSLFVGLTSPGAVNSVSVNINQIPTVGTITLNLV